MNVLDSGETTLSYRKLRAPEAHAQSLQIPPLAECKLDGESLARLQAASSDHICLFETALKARREVLELATDFTHQYRNTQLAGRSQTDIVMSGHQPNLFHPGVWFKNFALSFLGKRLNALPVNLVVDNDICGVASVRVPRLDPAGTQLDWVPIDSTGDNVPFEERRIQDLELFRGFASRANDAIRPFSPDPIVNQLWQFIRPAENEQRLGQTMATARHAYEETLGLQTLELPLSRMAQTSAFADFACEILFRIEGFQQAYNARLVEYRQIHRIRSRSHPVPELGFHDGWFETPFWVWSQDQPIRRGLYARLTADFVELSDLKRTPIRLPRASFPETFRGLGKQGFVVRPRALITTLFSRLLVSDLFLHGIGGAKYDQLTDAIAADFFGIQPPPFVTVTATMKLPGRTPNVTSQEVSRIRSLIRELRFHPETHLPNGIPEIESIIARKRDWLSRELPVGRGRERHRAIEACNAELQPFVAQQKSTLQQSLLALTTQHRSSQILASREYSFCLFPESLAGELANLTAGLPAG